MSVRDKRVGQTIDGRFELLERIGEGGMGVVYKARQLPIDRMVAVKMLSKEIAKDPQWVARFNNEARACSRLTHPNTIRMFDFGQTRSGELYMVMELLEGKTLREALRDAPFAESRVLKIIVQCCASLGEAHAAGIIHRDIKPDNVILTALPGQPEFVKLLDFSVAKLLQESDRMRTQVGVVFGTPQYMSPEQGRGMPLDARSDLYALGILAFEMLTATLPFNDPNPARVIDMHIKAAVPDMPRVSDGVRSLTRRMLAKEPGSRFQSAGELMTAAQNLIGASMPVAPPVGAPARPVFGAGANAATLIAGADGAPVMAPSASAARADGAASRSPLSPLADSRSAVADPSQRTMIVQPDMAVPSSSAAPRMPALNQPATPARAHSGKDKTMLLDPNAPAVATAAPARTARDSDAPASVFFWLISVATGVVVGALAFFVTRWL